MFTVPLNCFICSSSEADPNILGKYVIALVKKSKTEEELRDVCMQELDVFLHDRKYGTATIIL